MKPNWLNKIVAAWILAAVALTGINIACEHGSLEIVDEHGYHHQGYYDEHHDWHGGYYDEHHEYHDDAHDFHR